MSVGKITKKKKKKECEEMEKKEEDFVEKKIEYHKREAEKYRRLAEEHDDKAVKFEEIGDSAMYISDILEMLGEYKRKNYQSVQKLLEDMEIEITNTVIKAE